MRRRLASLVFVAMLAVPVGGASQQSPASAPAEQVAATPALELQVLLDRAGFSPGEIDGVDGANTKRALQAFEAARPGTGDDLRARLGAESTQALVSYTVTAEDVAGPFAGDIPDDLMQQATLPALGYSSAIEALGERFHSAPALLRHLNPRSNFAAGDDILVPNVQIAAPAKGETPADVVVTVSKSSSSLTVRGTTGAVILHAPVTSGSAHDPLPIGEWTVTAIGRNPTFHYNPDLFWDADPTHAKATIAPGPNNPVGVVWIDLDKEHYGIHGTPEPGRVGHTASHGCVRLTNWDALRLAALVRKGTRVVFEP